MMTPDYFLEIEKKTLSPYAQLTSESKGRVKPETSSPVRTAYQRDRDRIIHSKAFRRLMHKTQVFLSPVDEHYRTRMTHTLEVTQIARIIARALRLNEDLTEAIALGHDLGHTPFGHAGEAAFRTCFDPEFHHARQSLRVVDRIENDGEGLNLTFEVRDGILNHSGKSVAATLEGRIVKIADVFDALVSKRSYKDKWSYERAITYIMEHSGTEFDPDVVHAFMECGMELIELKDDGLAAQSDNADAGEEA